MTSDKARSKSEVDDKTFNLLKTATELAAEATSRLQTQQQSLNDIDEQKRLMTAAVMQASVQSDEGNGQNVQEFINSLLQQGIRMVEHGTAESETEDEEEIQEQDENADNAGNNDCLEGFVKPPPRQMPTAPQGMRYERMFGCLKCANISCDRLLIGAKSSRGRALQYHIERVHPGEKMKDLCVERADKLRKA